MEDLKYNTGFGSYFETEAKVGCLPKGRNSPKKSPEGLYPEQLSGSSFTMSRHENLRSWLYRIRPSVVQGNFQKVEYPYWVGPMERSRPTSPDPLRWFPPEEDNGDNNFLEGLRTFVSSGTVSNSVSVSQYQFRRGMANTFFYNSDGELLFLPEKGGLRLITEMGVLSIEPQDIAVIPRGVKFKVDGLQSGICRGYLVENTGRPFRLPDLGPLGSNGLANPRDFQYPVAAYEEDTKEYDVLTKFHGNFWKTSQQGTPFDVVAWHGNYAPYKYNLKNFNTMGSVSFDHPDPSIYTVLTSPSSVPGEAHCDFVIFPPRWLVAEETFRPPYYHRNRMSEFMGLIHGAYDAKTKGFLPGGASLHNQMTPHGPDQETFEKASESAEDPVKVENTMAFMVETSNLFRPTDWALSSAQRDLDYVQCWQKLPRNFVKKGKI